MGKEATSAAVLGMPININTLRLPTPGGGQGFSAVQQSMLEALKLTPPQQFKDWHVGSSRQLPVSLCDHQQAQARYQSMRDVVSCGWSQADANAAM